MQKIIGTPHMRVLTKCWHERKMPASQAIYTKGQHNQTLGIPIGPDTSRILSEITAVGIEQEF
jgi:hypothetical protein